MRFIFWAVDCQKDFLNKDGKLYVEGAEAIKPNLKRLTDIANKYDITTVATFDWHEPDDEELSATPDFKNTFPEHCMKYSDGAALIPDMGNIKSPRFNISKQKFDVFDNNEYADDTLEHLNPDTVIVFGVASNVCVNFAVLGLVARGYKVVVVKDAIKELPQLDVNVVYESWEKAGVIFEITANIEKVFCIKE